MYGRYQKDPDPRNGWILLGFLMLLSVAGLFWLNEKMKPRELFAPHYEEPQTVPSDREPVS